MTTDTTPPCANCLRLQAEVDSLRAELEDLRAVVAQLQRQLAAARKDSSNSSKPPSSDIVKPPKPPPPGQQRRKPGGQPGHTSHQRVPFPAEMLASIPTDYLLGTCPSCGGHLLLTDDAEPIVVQQVEIAAVPLEIHEYRSHPGWCPHCQKEC
jgi:transposase